MCEYIPLLGRRPSLLIEVFGYSIFAGKRGEGGKLGTGGKGRRAMVFLIQCS
jgi:hypothetical protein